MSTETAGTDETPSPPNEPPTDGTPQAADLVAGPVDPGGQGPDGGPTPFAGHRRRVARRRAQRRPAVGTGRPWYARAVEAALIASISLVLAVYMTWPMAKTLSKTVPGEPSDPIYFAWQLAWVAHALGSDPGQLWTTPAFLGAENNLAFTDTMLGYAPLGLVTGTDMVGGIRMLNIATMLTFALAFAGAYALARALGSRVPGALLAGAGFAYAPWRMEQIIHLNILSTGGMALAIAFLVRGHGWSLRYGLRPHTRSTGFVVAGWLVATWQITLGFGIGVVFGYMLGGVVALLAIGWLSRARYRRWLTWRFVVTDVAGAVLFLVTAALLTIPYNRVIELHPEAKRDAGWLPSFSPPWKGFLIAPDTNNFWGLRQAEWRSKLYWPHEMVVSPGIVLGLLAVVGVLFSAWRMRRRMLLLLYTAVMTALAFGTAFPWWDGKYTFMLAYNHLPGWNSMRTPGRLIIWVTLGLCLLAAGLIDHLVDRILPLPQDGVLADVPRPDVPPWRADRADVVASERVEAGADVYGERLERAYAAGLTPAPPRMPVAWMPYLLAVVLAGALCFPAWAVIREDRSTVQQWDMYRPPIPLADLPSATLVLPTSQVGDYQIMLWQADGWPRLANGDSGFYPKFQEELEAKTATFPDDASVTYLRAKGVKSVMVIDYLVQDSPSAAALTKSVTGLDIVRHTMPNGVWFDLRTPQER